MGRKLIIQPKEIFNQVGMNATENLQKTMCENVDLISYDLSFTNGAALNAVMTFQFSHDNEDWRDLQFGTTMSLTGANDVHRVDIETNFKYVRPVINFIAGSMDLNVTVRGSVKGA